MTATAAKYPRPGSNADRVIQMVKATGPQTLAKLSAELDVDLISLTNTLVLAKDNDLIRISDWTADGVVSLPGMPTVAVAAPAPAAPMELRLFEPGESPATHRGKPLSVLVEELRLHDDDAPGVEAGTPPQTECGTGAECLHAPPSRVEPCHSISAPRDGQINALDYALFGSGRLLIEKGGARVELTLAETREFFNYLDRMRPIEAAA